MRNKSGFTLIEISIVLVVIGLLAAGVLVGQTLIRAAEIRKTIKQREEFETAVNTFRGKYNCIPGDCANAFELGLATDVYPTLTYGQDGNGNGIIGYLQGETEFQTEAASFWYHLSQSDLISWEPHNPQDMDLSISCGSRGAGPCLAYSTSAANGNRGGWWIHGTYAGVFITNAPNFAQGHYWWVTGGLGLGWTEGSAVLVPADAYAIDVKIDDGLPLRGIALAAGDVPAVIYGPGDAVSGSGGTDVCINVDSPGNETYNIINTNRVASNMCSLLIRAGF